MKSIYGMPAKDGYIHCKNCGEILCPEDTSLFDGFSDDKPIQLREVIENNDDNLEIIAYLTKNHDNVIYINQISSLFNVTLNDNHIYDILILYSLIDHNILSDIRYSLTGVSESDIHPRVNKKVKEIQKKENKQKIKMKNHS